MGSRFWPQFSGAACAWWQWSAGFACLGVLAASLGCGSNSVDGRYALAGTVTFQGAPLSSGTIEFSTPDQSKITGCTIADGAFSVPAEQGLPPGVYQVKISSVEDAVAVGDAAPGPETMLMVGKERIPPEFNAQTQLKAEVTPSAKNSFSFTIP